MKNEKYILESVHIDYIESSRKYNLTIEYISLANENATYIKCSKELSVYKLSKDHILGIVDEIIMEIEDDRKENKA